MSKSCFLRLSSHNPAGMRCGFRNSCGLGQTGPGGKEGDGAGPAGTQGCRTGGPCWRDQGQQFSRDTPAPQAAPRSERPLGPGDWTISPVASRTRFRDVAPGLASHSSHPHLQAELSYPPSEKSW